MNLSVVIPAYDLAGELDRTLAGIVAQRHVPDDLEVIVVDLDSRVDSLEAVHRRYRDELELYLVQLPRLRHQYSLCRGRNTGIRLARNEWVVCLDADCIPGPSYFDNLRRHLKTRPSPHVVLSAERVFVDTRHLAAADIMADARRLDRAPRTPSASNYHLLEDRRLTRLRRLSSGVAISQPWDLIQGCNAVFRREDAVGIGGYDESFDGYWGYEDIDFAHRIIAGRGCVPVYAEGCHVFHQERSGPDEWREVRGRKAGNPNWERICERIDGYREFKSSLYGEIPGVSV